MDDQFNQSPNQFRHETPETPTDAQPLIRTESTTETTETFSDSAFPTIEATANPMNRWLTGAIIVLGLLLVGGGIVWGMRTRNNNDIVELPEYEASFVSPEATQPPTDKATVTPETTNAPATSAPRVATQATAQPAAPVQVTLKPTLKPVAKGASTVKTVATKIQPTSQPTTQPTATLPEYQPVVALADYQPQFVPSPSPSPTPTAKQTLTISLNVVGKTYTLEIQPGTTVLGILEAAKAHGLTYRTESTQYGPMIVEINGQGGDWVYTMNHTCVNTGAAAQSVKEGDSIVWKHPSSSVDCS